MGEKRGEYKVLLEIAEGKSPLRRPTRRWEGNIKMNLQVGWGGMDLIDLAQKRERLPAFVNAVINLRFP
jgi:hypothetical protein